MCVYELQVNYEVSNESKRTRETSSGRGPRGVPLPVPHPPLVVEAPLGLVHLPLNAGGEPARDELRLVLRRRARRQPRLVVHVRQPAVPLGGHGGRVVVVQVRVLYPSMTTRLVARVLEVLVAELVLADELALAGLELPVGETIAGREAGAGQFVGSRVGTIGEDGWLCESLGWNFRVLARGGRGGWRGERARTIRCRREFASCGREDGGGRFGSAVGASEMRGGRARLGRLPRPWG